MDEVTKKRGDRLPHWTHEGSVYHVTFRQIDSLPHSVLEEWQTEKDELLKRENLLPPDRERLKYLLSERVEKYLDASYGSCLMNNPEVADLVQGAIQSFDDERYYMHSWCIMPNHVHLVIQPSNGHKLPRIMHGLKSYTAHKINDLLDRSGPVWKPEYFDHLIRSQAGYEKVIAYVVHNPLKAGLPDWKWVYDPREK